MAKADFEAPFSGMRGRLDHDSNIYFTNRFGETVISHYPKHKDPKKITDRQKARHAVFRDAVAEADRQCFYYLCTLIRNLSKFSHKMRC